LIRVRPVKDFVPAPLGAGAVIDRRTGPANRRATLAGGPWARQLKAHA
jgi:hypothetical protein